MKTLEVAMIMPRFSTYSGGVRRTLKILEMSRSADIEFSVFSDLHRTMDKRISETLRNLMDRDVIDLYQRGENAERNVVGSRFDVAVIPSEFWVPSGLRLSSLRIKAPRIVEFQQIPYMTSLDILRIRGIEEASILDLLHMPRLSSQYYGDSRVQSTASLLLGTSYIQLLRLWRNIQIVAVSKTIANQLHQLMDKRKILVLDTPIGLDTEIVRRVREKADEEPIFDGVFSARFDPRKGFLDLPYILHFARRTLGRELKFALCGITQSRYHDKLFWKRVRELKLEGSITFFGDIESEEALLEIMSKSRCAICPSYGDAFPTTVLQSISVGVPVISYDLDVVRLDWSESKAIATARIGNREEFGVCFGKLLRDDGLRLLTDAASDESRSLIQRFTWQNVIRDERRIYEDVIDK